MTHSEKQNRVIETIPEEVKTLHLLEKDFIFFFKIKLIFIWIVLNT